MAINKEKKKKIVSEVSEVVKDADSVVFVNFHGLPVADTTILRKTLKGQGIGYLVSKKTLAKRALSEAKIEGALPVMEGELALAYGKDLIAPAREVYAFQKKYPNLIQIIGGIFEKRYMNKEEMTDIAAIPTLQVLYGQVVNLINSPIQQFVMALGQIAKSKE
ncbi:MAG: 50S ribosomal protein L10 [Parcubacteria group bacterium]|nr:50S ribosomal protein L10 [Parcubacteria group bacterium]